MTIKSLISAMAFGVAASFSVASAQTTSAVTAEELESALQAAGLTPSMTEDAATGAPVANATVGEIMFWVRAMDCGGSPTACENLIFFANFDLGRAVSATDYRVVNNFNDSQLFGRAYILERQNQVGVDYVVELGGGVSSDHLTQNVSRWTDVIDAFVQKFSSGDTSS